MVNQKNIVVIGASGSIGKALIQLYSQEKTHQVFAFSRSVLAAINQDNIMCAEFHFEQEDTIRSAAALVAQQGGADILIIATGLLHQQEIQPEKSIKRITPEAMAHIMFVNTIGPALVLKHFVPLMPKNRPYIIAALSARVGSIADNSLGGWYSYRASKAALNMILKTASIEATRANDQSVLVGLHPGTVDSHLSKPFQSGVPANKLFSADDAAEKLIQVIASLTPEHTGQVFAWDGQRIEH